jgi:hypothetical protein
MCIINIRTDSNYIQFSDYDSSDYHRTDVYN